jgi:hypothetical protein
MLAATPINLHAEAAAVNEEREFLTDRFSRAGFEPVSRWVVNFHNRHRGTPPGAMGPRSNSGSDPIFTEFL